MNMQLCFLFHVAIIHVAFSFSDNYIDPIRSPPNSPGDFINSGTPGGVPLHFDCAVREFAYSYGQSLQPRHGLFTTLFDALQLQACNMSRPKQEDEWIPPKLSPNPTHSHCIYYIDSINGNDNNNGAITTPFKTIQYGINTARNFNRNPANEICYLNLRNGTYYLNTTINLTSQDSYLTIQNYNGEYVTISGGIQLNINENNWKLYDYDDTKWKIYNNSNNCMGRTNGANSNDEVKYIGNFSNINSCINAVQNNQLNFYSFCYNDCQLNSTDACHCYGIVDISWQPMYQKNVYSGSLQGKNIWYTNINNINTISGLRINNKRAIRSRYPDAIPEISMQFYSLAGWIPYTTKWIPPIFTPSTNIIINNTNNGYPENDVIWPMSVPAGYEPNTQYTGSGAWGNFWIGAGGPCTNLDPSFGYWCSMNPPRGAITHKSPSGIILQAKQILPNAPYNDISGITICSWRPSHWFTWMWTTDNNKNYNVVNGNLTFSKGGDQGGEGADKGAEWWIENVFEELSMPNEYYYNESMKMLYFFYNSSNGSKQAPPTGTNFVSTKLQTLFNLNGNQKQPIKNISFNGIVFRDTAISYMETHGLPSGGDWAMVRVGGLNFIGTENCTINSSLFTRLDGNAIFIGEYNRNLTIENNDFEWIGETAIVSWGMYNQSTPDGTNGNQPRFTIIRNNLVREIGIWQKQASAYFQATSCQAVIENNIFFNGPRAMINFNDGFGGSNIIRWNLIFNACRESGDHGPFNSWDRVPYITKVRDGFPSILPGFNKIYQNFIIATYESQEAIDNDDGSVYYETFNNFFVYAEYGIKSDFGGHTNRHYRNIYAYVGAMLGERFGGGPDDELIDNSIILRGNGGYSSDCYAHPGELIFGNSIYCPSGTLLNVCNGKSLKEWVNEGNDPGTTVNGLPTDQQIIQWAKQLLYVNNSQKH